MLEEVFDRQGLLVVVSPSKSSYVSEYAQPERLRFTVVRPSGQVELRSDHVREMHAALGTWLDKIDRVGRKR